MLPDASCNGIALKAGLFKLYSPVCVPNEIPRATEIPADCQMPLRSSVTQSALPRSTRPVFGVDAVPLVTPAAER